uniref:Uncharacterized protein n=1 Tax=Arundo donax TaxID=35708 RepID=A0A0A9F2U4_ARUDO
MGHVCCDKWCCPCTLFNLDGLTSSTA